MRGTTCCEQDASLAIIRRALRFERIVANADVATTTYTYDANGNVTKAGGWTYVWDYLNRMLASGYNNSTTTYSYDAMGARVLQTSTTSTTYYPSKFFSLASTTNGGTSWATSTNYIWLGDTLLATIDQKLYNGTATGTAITRYVHPDNLGSTNVVTDASGTAVQLLDYYPYGSTRVSSSTFPTNEKRQYIGQFMDAQTGLDYLNARYYEGQRGQFMSQDPVFWEMGLTQDGKSAIANPQMQNSYSYASDNPVVNKDAMGRFAVGLGLNGGGNIPGMYGEFSTMPVLVVGTRPFNVEVGVMDSGGGGGTTAILGADLKGQFMYSPNAQSIQDLKGVDVTAGASIKYGVDVGYDVSMSKSDKPNKPAMTYTGSLGIGGVATPYALPAEVHGGVNYSKPIVQYNLTPTIANVRSTTISSAQYIYSYIQAQINSIRQQIQTLQNQAPQYQKDTASNKNK